MCGFAKACELVRRNQCEILMIPPRDDDRVLAVFDLVSDLREVLAEVAVRCRGHVALVLLDRVTVASRVKTFTRARSRCTWLISRYARVRQWNVPDAPPL